MAVGAGAKQGILEQMSSLLNNNITIQSNGGYTQRTSEEINGYVKEISLTKELAEELETAFPELSGIVTYGGSTFGEMSDSSEMNMTWGSVEGVPYGALQKLGYTFTAGEDFTEQDFDKKKMVVVIDKNVSDNLFPNSNAVGQTMIMNKKEYTIIGVLKETTRSVYVPLTTYQNKISGSKKIDSITVKLGAEDDADLRTKRIQYFLIRKYGVKHIDLAGFSVTNNSDVGDSIDEAMGLMNILLGAIGSISLLVGGIGVMNIMLVSVTERTREIWIRKAIWALNKDIIQQFLIESIVITLIGGAIAVWFSFLIVHIVSMFNIEDLTLVITSDVVFVALILTIVIGILSGILPAKRAANLKPIDALRFE